MESGQPEHQRPERAGLEALALFAFLFLFWVILSGRYQLSSLLLGAGCAVLVTLMTRDRFLLVGRTQRDFGVSVGRISPLGMLRYGAWLLLAIIQANLQVAYLVLHPRMPVAPRVLRFNVGFENRIPQVVLAHSITLTPGTVSIDLEEGEYLVHALVPRSAEGVVSGEMQKRIAAVFGEEPETAPAIRWHDSITEAGEAFGGEVFAEHGAEAAYPQEGEGAAGEDVE